ncbi:MAG: toll/interleukin-1 receptor domain-containing protein, partial [Pseudomonadota bacterium]
MTSGQKNRQYTAFISYSHSDEASASWLHRALETFSAPNGVAVPEGLPVRDRRLAPIFRDREELSSSHDLSESIRSAIEASHALIVICSPAAAASRWVNEEIKLFKRLHGEERILALIVDGEDGGPVPFFPEALLQRLGPDGEIIDDRGEPLAADIRPGKDGKRHAKLKLAAGLLDVGLDTLVQRDAARERRRLTAIAGAAVAVMLMTAGLAAFALVQRDEARAQRVVAEQQSET